jgi:hypothetical protein
VLAVPPIEVIQDWPRRFETYAYDFEKRRIVNKCLEKMRMWFELYNSTDWKNVSSDSGLVVDSKTSERGLSILRASKILPYKAEHVFKTMTTRKYRKLFDENIEESYFLSKICANTYTSY